LLHEADSGNVRCLDLTPISPINFTNFIMTAESLVLVLVIGLANTCVVQAQVAVPAELPAESPSPAKKHRQHKRAEATASLAETAASPATAESPAASPKARRSGKKAQTEATASPAASPTPSPKFRFGDLFKPKSSVSASPSAAPVIGGTGTATPAPGSGHGLVWVNTETHVYHKEGSRFYGTTKKGKYVSEADAIKEGDKPAAKEGQ
jgi:cytoskeletal protein RodZ